MNRRRRAKVIALLFIILLSLGVLPACNDTLRDSPPISSHDKDKTKGKVLNFSTEGEDEGETILSSYTGSYALLIGESKYTNGWSKLGTIPGELRKVESLLKSKGFHVELSFNLNARQLEARFRQFINNYGFDENNRSPAKVLAVGNAKTFAGDVVFLFGAR